MSSSHNVQRIDTDARQNRCQAETLQIHCVPSVRAGFAFAELNARRDLI